MFLSSSINKKKFPVNFFMVFISMNELELSGVKVLPIVSGGIDSTTMLWYLKDRGAIIKEVLTVDYGQKHRKEIEMAKKIVNRFNEEFGLSVNHLIIDMSFLQKLLKSALTGDKEVPKEMYDAENQKVTVVPNRNMILISVAAGRAISIGAELVAYAAHASDYEVYPDCRPEFVEALDKALRLGNLWTPVGVIAPFVRYTKAEIVKLGLKLRVPYELTWSCYEGKERPCLECGTCLERTEAFLINKFKDPALTDEEWSLAVKLYEKHKEAKKEA